MKIFRSRHTETLFQALSSNLQTPLADPFAQDQIVVQNKAMADWLSLGLARQKGVVANLAFPFPKKFIQNLLADYLGPRARELSRFNPELTFGLVYSILQQQIQTPAFLPLQAFWENNPTQKDRFLLAMKIANQLDQYSLFRPEWCLAWERGDYSVLSEEQQWQGLLWRELSQSLGGNHLAALVAALNQLPESQIAAPAALPRRVHVFGISSLSPLYLQVLFRLAQRAEVHFYHLIPSKEYWSDIRSQREIIRELNRSKNYGFTAEDLHLTEGHPLLASWGKVGREFQMALECFEEGQSLELDTTNPAPQTLLEILQQDIYELKQSPLAASHLQDGSLQIHSTFSPYREVEVLRDLILEKINSGAEPIECMVMVSDVNLYRPLIEEVFSRPDPKLPFSISDLNQTQDNPILLLVEALLELSQGRFTNREVIGLLRKPLVRVKLGWQEEEVETIEDWIQAANIRWGETAASRAEYGLPAFAANTWQAGLEQLLLGMTLPESQDSWAQQEASLNAVEGAKAILLGQFIDFLHGLSQICQQLRQTQPLEDWCDHLQKAVQALACTQDAGGYADEWSAGLADLRLRALAMPLEPSAFGLLFQMHFSALPANRGFMTRGITFAGMMPMRAIPFSHIFILGLSERQFPRLSHRQGFDLMVKSPALLERIQKEEDRYLFLEALLCARQSLTLLYQGKNAKSLETIAPSNLIGELLATLAEALPLEQRGEVAQWVVQHPLQAFHPAYFQGSGPLFSYSNWYLQAALVLANPPQILPQAPLVLERESQKSVTLRELIQFLGNPTKAFYQKSLDIRLNDPEPGLPEREPIELDSLEKYKLTQNLLHSTQPASIPLLQAKGVLPPGGLGEKLFIEQAEIVRDLQAAAAPFLEDNPWQGPLQGEVGNLRIELEDTYQNGLIQMIPAKLQGKNLLSFWVEHLAFCCLCPEPNIRSVLITKDDNIIQLGHQPQAQAWLSDLLALQEEGLAQPLPFFPKTGWVFVEKEATQGIAKALLEAQTKFQEESEDRYVNLHWSHLELAQSDFPTLSRRILQPLLQALQGGQ